MPLTHGHRYVRYLRAAGYQAVDLDYRGDDLSMLVLLPDREGCLGEFEKGLSTSVLRDCAEKAIEREVKVFLPRFGMTWGAVDLREQLCALGMPLAFIRSEADFSGINGHGPGHEDALFVSSVLHKRRRRLQCFVLTIPSCSPSANETPARSCS